MTVLILYSVFVQVGGMNKFGQRMSRSNYGECVDVYAPGECIIGASSRDPTDYIRMNGTSFAAPHVAGIVALMLEQDNHLTLEQVKERKLPSANEIPVYAHYERL